MASWRQKTVDQVNRYRVEITVAARRIQVAPEVLKGLVAQESGGVQYAMRREPGYRWKWGDDAHERPMRRPKILRLTDFLDIQEWSFGLGQIMAATAYWLGFNAWPGKLFEVECNLAWCSKYLRWCLDRTGGNLKLALLRYNGGGNTAYPDEVMSWAAEFQEGRNGQGQGKESVDSGGGRDGGRRNSAGCCYSREV